VASEEPTTSPGPERADFHAQVTGIAALAEPVRRGLYRFVVAQAGPVTRDQAASGMGVARHVAKFHLDKLVEDGLLEVGYSRPPGRSGPGAGRPAKLYRRAQREISVNLPARDYQLAARIFARALGLDGDEAPDSRLLDSARELGLEIGRQARGPQGLLKVLAAYGYEPFADGARVRLRNCPFHALARDFQDPVCGMNLAFLDGVREAAGAEGLSAQLDKVEGLCCVTFESRR